MAWTYNTGIYNQNGLANADINTYLNSINNSSNIPANYSQGTLFGNLGQGTISPEVLGNYTQQLGYNPMQGGNGLQGMNWGSAIGAGAAGISALTGLGSLALGYKNYGLAKQQFSFEKGLANRNLANQAQIINNQIDASANVAGQLNRRNEWSSTEYQAERDRVQSNADKTKVDGSKI